MQLYNITELDLENYWKREKETNENERGTKKTVTIIAKVKRNCELINARHLVVEEVEISGRIKLQFKWTLEMWIPEGISA